MPYLESNATLQNRDTTMSQYRATLTHQLELGRIEPVTGFDLGKFTAVAFHYYRKVDSYFQQPEEMTTTSVLASGLLSDNVSSAYDMSHLIAFAGADPRLAPVLRTAEYRVATSRRSFSIHSTNKLLGTDVDVRGGKTGFISKAGYCLATLLQVPQGSQVAVVVLGAANSATRFWEARHLFNWVVGKAQGIIGDDDAKPAGAAARIR